MGILNCTPDSFSDGGRALEPAEAIGAALRMAEEGAEVLDVGAESTRPGSERVPAELQIARLRPVLQGLRDRGFTVPITVDTTRAEVAEAALGLGAMGINDISAGRDDAGMFGVVAKFDAALVLMHMQGTPGTMQVAPRYSDVVAEVTEFLRERVEAAVAAGVRRGEILVDAGIGFGKTAEHNLALLGHLGEIRSALGQRMLVGASRKSFIGAITGRKEPGERVFGSVAVAAWAAMQGADAVRAHDVGPTRDALLTIAAILERA